MTEPYALFRRVEIAVWEPGTASAWGLIWFDKIEYRLSFRDWAETVKRKRNDGWPEWREWLWETPCYRERLPCSGLLLKGRWKWAHPLMMVWLGELDDQPIAVLTNGYEVTPIIMHAVRRASAKAPAFRGRMSVERVRYEQLVHPEDRHALHARLEAEHRAFRRREEARARTAFAYESALSATLVSS